jgi:hypothetical protein
MAIISATAAIDFIGLPQIFEAGTGQCAANNITSNNKDSLESYRTERGSAGSQGQRSMPAQRMISNNLESSLGYDSSGDSLD